MTLAAFDFDGTLTRKDTLWEFIRYVVGDTHWMLGMLWLFPSLLSFKLGRIDNQTAKERVLTYFLGGRDAEELYCLGNSFTEKHLPGILRKEGIEKIKWHQAQGHRCYLVTASLDIWTREFAAQYGLTLVSSIPEIKEGVFTGKIAGDNCRGKEKVRRLLAVLGEISVEKSFAYGDSSGDMELLEWADEGNWRRF